MIDSFLSQYLTEGWVSLSHPPAFYHSQTAKGHADSTALSAMKHVDSNIACWDCVG